MVDVAIEGRSIRRQSFAILLISSEALKNSTNRLSRTRPGSTLSARRIVGATKNQRSASPTPRSTETPPGAGYFPARDRGLFFAKEGSRNVNISGLDQSCAPMTFRWKRPLRLMTYVSGYT